MRGRGDETIRTCGLNRNSGRNSLVEVRRTQVDLARVAALERFEHSGHSIIALKEWLAEYETDGGPYVGAVRCAIRRLLDRWRAELSTL